MANSNISVAFRRLRGLGLTAEQAAGAVGALTGESGPNLDPSARNPTSGAIGIGQWLGGRAKGVQSGDFEGQLNHLINELQGSERGALNALRRAKTAGQAAEIFTRQFERPSASEIASSLDARKAAANKVLATHGNEAGSFGATDPAVTQLLGGGGAFATTTRKQVAPAQDFSSQRALLALSFLSQQRGNPLDFVTKLQGLQDIPAQYSTTRTVGQTTPSARQSADSAGGPSVSAFGRGHSKLLELIHNTGSGPGYAVKNGAKVSGPGVYGAVWAGHRDHVHVAAGPQTIVELGRLAQHMGLHVGENPHFGGVSGGHAPDSYHYRGEAIDVGGSPRKMAAFAAEVERLYGIK